MSDQKILQVLRSWNPYRKRVKVAPGDRPVPGLEVVASNCHKDDDEKNNDCNDKDAIFCLFR